MVEKKQSIFSKIGETKLDNENLGNFSVIPKLVLFYLFSFIDPKKLFSLFVLNKSFCQLLSNDNIWKAKCNSNFALPVDIWNKNENVFFDPFICYYLFFYSNDRSSGLKNGKIYGIFAKILRN